MCHSVGHIFFKKKVCLRHVNYIALILLKLLQVFDSFVILASFVVDIIFMKGLAVYTIHEFVYILAFMLPWRVIRVTNSEYLNYFDSRRRI